MQGGQSPSQRRRRRWPLPLPDDERPRPRQEDVCRGWPKPSSEAGAEVTSGGGDPGERRRHADPSSGHAAATAAAASGSSAAGLSTGEAAAAAATAEPRGALVDVDSVALVELCVAVGCDDARAAAAGFDVPVRRHGHPRREDSGAQRQRNM